MRDGVPVPYPGGVPGRARHTGALEPALRWLARCQGAWPPHRPQAVHRVEVSGGSGGSLDTGLARADAAVDAGCDLLVVSGSGDQAPGVLVTAALLDLEPVRAVGTSDEPGWRELVVAVRDGLPRARVHRVDPQTLLRVVQAGAVAEAAGLLAGASDRRTPVLLDGSALVAAAALVANRLRPGAAAWWLAGQAPPLPAARSAHADVGLAALLDLRLALPEGADLALQVLLRGVDLVTSPDAVTEAERG